VTNFWFTADTHFGHANLVYKIKDRPFSSIEEMDETLISNWNSVVKPGDLVYHLGDFSWPDCSLYVDRLNGNIQLIKGNHDRQKDKDYDMFFNWVGDYKKIRIDGQKLILFHYPIRSWNAKHWGSWHLFGHTHNSILPELGSCDVGVDCWDFFPVSYEQLMVYFDKQKEILPNVILNPTPCNDFDCRCGDTR